MTHRTVHEWGRVAVGYGGFSRGEANALLDAARRHPLGGVDGTDVLCDHHSYIRARQMVGVIAARGCSLEILPKVDPVAPDEPVATVRARLVNMLDVVLGLDLGHGNAASMARGAQSLLDIFIAQFANGLLDEVRRGLPRMYRERSEDLRALRGRLDVVRQFTVHAVRPDRLACIFDALDPDTPLMRIMKACVVLLAGHARLTDTQRKLVELRFLLADVTDVPRGRLSWAEARIDRTSLRWRTLFELAKLLLRESWQQTHASSGDPSGITLLFPMNKLFERYIAVQTRRALAGSGLDVVAQGGREYCLGNWFDGQECVGSEYATFPDIIVRNKTGTQAILDTKWKRPDGKVAQSDIYQMMAYARLYRCNHLILLYPATTTEGRSGEPTICGLARGLERLQLATISLGEADSQVRADLRRLLIPNAKLTAQQQATKIAWDDLAAGVRSGHG